MAITLVSSGTATGAVFASGGTLPTHQAGDLIIISARRASNTPADLPADWTNIQAAGANTLSLRTGVIRATNSSTLSGTWTNASHLVASVFRSTTGKTLVIGASSTANNSGNTNLPYPALTLTGPLGAVTVYRAGIRNTAVAAVANPPTNYTFIASTPSPPGLAAHYRLSVAANPTLDNVAMGASASQRAHSVEIIEVDKAATLVEDFATDDGTFVDGVAGGSITGGQVSVPYLTTGALKQTALSYDLTESSVYVEAFHDAAHASNETRFGFGTAGGWFDANQFQFIAVGSDLFLREVNGAGGNSDTTIAYNATTMRWWRLRYSGTSVFWDTSPDGLTWTEQRTKTAVFTPIAGRVKLGSFNFAGNQATVALFDNVNNAATAHETTAGPFALATGFGAPAVTLEVATTAGAFAVPVSFGPANSSVEAFPGDPGAGVLLSGCTVWSGSAGVASAIDWMDTATGRRHVLSRTYSTNGNGWDWTQIDDDLAVDRIPFHTSKFTNFTNAQIVAGSADAALATQASNAIARAPSAIWLGFYHEPEDNFESDAAAAEFRAAARYIVGYMRTAGVTNVAWVFPVWMTSWSFRGGETARGPAYKWDIDWKGTTSGAGVPNSTDWYTGAEAMTDVIGMDQYTPWIGGTSYNTFNYDVGYACGRLFTEWSRPVKPIAIGECGTKDTASPTPNWTTHFAELLESCIANDVRGLVYYNTDANNFVNADPGGERFDGYNAMIHDTRVGDVDVPGVPDEPTGGGPPAFVDGTTGGGGGLISHTVPWPVDVQDGDYAVLSWVYSTTQTHVLPAGFTLVSTFDGDSGSHRMAVCERICDGTETGTVTIELSGITKQCATLTVYRGLHPTDPLDSFAVHNATGTLVHNCPAVTTGFDDCIIASIYSERVTDATANATIASPYVERADAGGTSSAGGGGTMVAFADDGLAVSRPSGSVVTPPDWTGTTSTANVITWTLSLRPAEQGTAHTTTAGAFAVNVAYSSPTPVRASSTAAGVFATTLGLDPPAVTVERSTTTGPFAVPVGYGAPSSVRATQTTTVPFAVPLDYGMPAAGVDSTRTAEPFTVPLTYGAPVAERESSTIAEPFTVQVAYAEAAGTKDATTTAGPFAVDVEFVPAGTAGAQQTTAEPFNLAVGFGAPGSVVARSVQADPLTLAVAYGPPAAEREAVTTGQPFNVAVNLTQPTTVASLGSTATPFTLTVQFEPATAELPSIAGITITDVDGPGTSTPYELTGVGVARAVTGIGTGRTADGPGVATPAATVGVKPKPAITGPGMGDRETLTGVGTSRAITGVGV